MVITDGVFSMEGAIAPLPDLVEHLPQARRGPGGGRLACDRGAGRDRPRHGGAFRHGGRGGHHHLHAGQGAGRAPPAGSWRGPRRSATILTQRARPQLFSNALPPTVAASALASVEYLEAHPERVTRLRENARYFRDQLVGLGFKPLPGETPIIPVILGETADAIRMSELLLEEGVFVTGFGYPVVPQGQARVRCQVSAAHTRADLDQALAAFAQVGRRLKLI